MPDPNAPAVPRARVPRSTGLACGEGVACGVRAAARMPRSEAVADPGPDGDGRRVEPQVGPEDAGESQRQPGPDPGPDVPVPPVGHEFQPPAEAWGSQSPGVAELGPERFGPRALRRCQPLAIRERHTAGPDRGIRR